MRLGTVGVDGAVLADAGLGDVEGEVRVRREVEDEPANVVGLITLVDLGPRLESRHAVKHHRLADGDSGTQVIAVSLVG